jgi:hypothetical protein
VIECQLDGHWVQCSRAFICHLAGVPYVAWQNFRAGHTLFCLQGSLVSRSEVPVQAFTGTRAQNTCACCNGSGTMHSL